jgi:hypothetical protein
MQQLYHKKRCFARGKMKKFKKMLNIYQNSRKTERKLTEFASLNCKIGRGRTTSSVEEGLAPPENIGATVHPSAPDTIKSYQNL